MIIVRSVSDGDKHFAQAIDEYAKRLGKSIQIINYKPSKKDNIAQVIQEDTDAIIGKLKSTKITKQKVIVLLSKQGKNMATDQWKGLIEDSQNAGKDIICLIGGPFGFDESRLKPLVNYMISFGAITMPHGLAKLVLLEQLYRCQQIIQGKQYHY